jgi:hypothetical protein
MNPIVSAARFVDQALIDRLVDGELQEDERRMLVAQLDQTSGGWRACAMAFLESQAWKGALRQPGAAPPVAPGRGLPERTAGPTRLDQTASSQESLSPRKRALRQLAGVMHKALAAGMVALAFAAGWFCRPLTVGDDDADQRREAAGAHLAGQPENNALDPDLDGPFDALEELGPAPRQAGMLRLFVPHEDGVEEVALPVVGGIPTNAELAGGARTALAPCVIRALERQGHRVTVQRDLLTLGLANGDGLVVPIERVNVQFAARVFQ